MLRAKLYLGMLPIVALLIGALLYSASNYSRMIRDVDQIRERHHDALLRMDQLLVIASEMERSLNRLERDAAESIDTAVFYQAASQVRELSEWPAGNGAPSPVEAELAALAEELLAKSEALAESGASLPIEVELVAELIAALEGTSFSAMEVMAEHNQAIRLKSAAFKRQARSNAVAITVSILLSLIGLAVTSYVLSRRILRPIDALTRSVDRLARDSWEIDFQPKSKGDIARLEAAFAEMATRIHAFHQNASRELQRSRRRMKECLDNFPHPIFFVNGRRQIVYANSSARELARAAAWSEGLPPSLMSRIESVLGTGCELLATDFDETLSFPLHNAPTHFLPLLIRIDAGEREESECALILQDITNLRLSNELKSDLVATVSHEIRTPVTSATIALHLLLDGGIGPLNEDQREMLDTADSDLKRLKRLLDHLLEIARLESRQPRLERSLAPPSLLVQNVIEAFSSTASDKGISLSAEIEAALPLVNVDAPAVDVAISNFVSNALKYAPAPSRVAVYCRRTSDNRIRIGVTDQGPGLEEENMERVFEKFYRSAGHRKMEGIGLGLSICKEIAIAHEGSVGVENRPGGGADFYLTLPAAASSVEDGEP